MGPSTNSGLLFSSLAWIEIKFCDCIFVSVKNASGLLSLGVGVSVFCFLSSSFSFPCIGQAVFVADGGVEIAVIVIGLVEPVLALFGLTELIASGPAELGPALAFGLTGTGSFGLCAVFSSLLLLVLGMVDRAKESVSVSVGVSTPSAGGRDFALSVRLVGLAVLSATFLLSFVSD